MKEIKLNDEYITLVDDCMYDTLIQFDWYASVNAITGKVYVSTFVKVNDIMDTYYLHRLLIDVNDDEDVDHKDGNSLNNQMYNLRRATKAQNCQNRKPIIGKSSKYKGVYYHKCRNNFGSQIKVNGNAKSLGTFIDEIEAAKTYDRAALYYFKDFAYLNFPELREEYNEFLSNMINNNISKDITNVLEML